MSGPLFHGKIYAHPGHSSKRAQSAVNRPLYVLDSPATFRVPSVKRSQGFRPQHVRRMSPSPSPPRRGSSRYPTPHHPTLLLSLEEGEAKYRHHVEMCEHSARALYFTENQMRNHIATAATQEGKHVMGMHEAALNLFRERRRFMRKEYQQHILRVTGLLCERERVAREALEMEESLHREQQKRLEMCCLLDCVAAVQRASLVSPPRRVSSPYAAMSPIPYESPPQHNNLSKHVCPRYVRTMGRLASPPRRRSASHGSPQPTPGRSPPEDPLEGWSIPPRLPSVSSPPPQRSSSHPRLSLMRTPPRVWEEDHGPKPTNLVPYLSPTSSLKRTPQRSASHVGPRNIEWVELKCSTPGTPPPWRPSSVSRSTSAGGKSPNNHLSNIKEMVQEFHEGLHVSARAIRHVGESASPERCCVGIASSPNTLRRGEWVSVSPSPPKRTGSRLDTSVNISDETALAEGPSALSLTLQTEADIAPSSSLVTDVPTKPPQPIHMISLVETIWDMQHIERVQLCVEHFRRLLTTLQAFESDTRWLLEVQYMHHMGRRRVLHDIIRAEDFSRREISWACSLHYASLLGQQEYVARLEIEAVYYRTLPEAPSLLFEPSLCCSSISFTHSRHVVEEILKYPPDLRRQVMPIMFPMAYEDGDDERTSARRKSRRSPSGSKRPPKDTKQRQPSPGWDREGDRRGKDSAEVDKRQVADFSTATRRHTIPHADDGCEEPSLSDALQHRKMNFRKPDALIRRQTSRSPPVSQKRPPTSYLGLLNQQPSRDRQQRLSSVQRLTESAFQRVSQAEARKRELRDMADDIYRSHEKSLRIQREVFFNKECGIRGALVVEEEEARHAKMVKWARGPRRPRHGAENHQPITRVLGGPPEEPLRLSRSRSLTTTGGLAVSTRQNVTLYPEHPISATPVTMDDQWKSWLHEWKRELKREGLT